MRQRPILWLKNNIKMKNYRNDLIRVQCNVVQASPETNMSMRLVKVIQGARHLLSGLVLTSVCRNETQNDKLEVLPIHELPTQQIVPN